MSISPERVLAALQAQFGDLTGADVFVAILETAHRFIPRSRERFALGWIGLTVGLRSMLFGASRASLLRVLAAYVRALQAHLPDRTEAWLIGNLASAITRSARRAP